MFLNRKKKAEVVCIAIKLFNERPFKCYEYSLLVSVKTYSTISLISIRKLCQVNDQKYAC